MEKLITDMMLWANVSQQELQEKQTIETEFGETLSWEYLSYVRNNPIHWEVPTDILYGSKDNLTSLETITAFAKKHNAKLTVMEDGEHWFHTKEQMDFLNKWITG
jgi:pimeloyl-ACP methyl ester carboxylesterase